MDSGDVVAIEVDGVLMTREDMIRMQRERLREVHASITTMRDRWVQYRARSGVENDWDRALALYGGDRDLEDRVGTLMDTARNGPAMRSAMHNVNRSRVVVNIVRPKVDLVTARMCEILLPVDDRNWGIKPTPMPQLLEIARSPLAAETIEQHTQTPIADAARSLIAEAKRRSDAMQTQIDDVLTECGYNAESRKVIEQGVLLGSSCMKGPFPTARRSARWGADPATGMATLIGSEEIVPASCMVDIRNIFPDPGCGKDIQRGRGIWEMRPVTAKELRALAGVPGYDAEVIDEVLRQAPQCLRVGDKNSLTRAPREDECYELWEYHGEVNATQMELMSSLAGGDQLSVSTGVLVMVNDRVIGAMESWTADGSLPYDIWCYRERDGSPFGIPYALEMEDQQRVVIAAWRQVMDNAAAAAGYQVVMKKGAVVPVNGQMQFESRKFWYANDEVQDVTKAFHVAQVNSNLDDLLKIATTAMQYAELESNTPQLLGGERESGNPETLGGMQIRMGNATGPMRWRVKRYDDRITRPHIQRHYDWQMQFNPDDSVKGDMLIDARGSTTLLERDIAAQATLNLAAVTNSPRYAHLFDEREEVIAILKAMKIDYERMLKPKEQVDQEAAERAKNPPPQDPKIEVAQIGAQVKQLELQDRAAARQQTSEMRAAELQMKREQITYQQQKEQGEFQIAMTEAELDRGIILARMEQDANDKERVRLSKERLETMKIDSKHQLFNAEASLRMRTGQGI